MAGEYAGMRKVDADDSMEWEAGQKTTKRHADRISMRNESGSCSKDSDQLRQADQFQRWLCDPLHLYAAFLVKMPFTVV
jgi:hypothetical protein